MRRLRRYFSNLRAMADIVAVLFLDVDRGLVLAAKKLARVRRERCDGKCECCDAIFHAARVECAEWRRLQQISRDTRSTSGAFVHALSGTMKFVDRL